MVLNVYKPKGWTSNDVVQKIKHSCGYKKVGHAGTLDPLAEGVLIVLTDADTKRQSEFISMEKEYLVKIAFGYESDSHDLETELRLVNKDIAEKLTRGDLRNALAKYIGKIKQQVPAYSAVHVNGRRLYKSARSNTSATPPLPYKDIKVYDIKICSFAKYDAIDYSINGTVSELRVLCGRGTYIRSLVRDLGKDLSCGAVAVSLIRTKVGDYKIGGSISIKEIASIS